MRFTPRFVDELRDRVRVTEVVGRKVKLIRRGRNYVGLCPFHNEKTPSFSVNEDKGYYHCFGCGAHGDILTFTMETEGLSFPEAVEKLALDAGMPLPARQEREIEQEQTRRSLYDVMAAAADFFERELQGPRGTKARSYLNGRQLAGPVVQQFRIGFAPDSRNGLREHLAAQGVGVDDMVAAGLLVPPEDGGAPYDRFRGRVMFPILDARERVIAFGGRTLDPDGKPKYLNSPETSLFRKSTVLFNLANARRANTQGASVIAVEGYVDVITLVAAGFSGAVAPLGTALTEEHLQILWRMTPEPILCFDGDSAGQKAAQRGIDVALPLIEPGQSLRIALLPDGLDPDDLIRARGSDAMKLVLDQAVALSDMLWRREIGDADLSTPERRAGAEASLFKVIDTISDMRVREHYRTMMRSRLRELFSSAQATQNGRSTGQKAAEFRSRSPSNWTRKASGTDRANRTSAQDRWAPPVSDAVRRSAAGQGLTPAGKPAGFAEEAIILAILVHPALIEPFAEALANLAISEEKLDKLRGAILHAASLEHSLDRHGLRDHLRKRGFGDLCERLERRPMLRSMAMTKAQTAYDGVEREFSHVLARHRKLTELEREHVLAADALQREVTEENLARLRAIDLELKSLSGVEAGPPDAF